MSETVKERRFKRFPVIKQFLVLLKKIKLPWLHGLSLYELIELYFAGIVEGAISYRASAIAWSFFMALFPFMLFILNLIPYIPIKGFQDDFLSFVQQSVPPTTYDAIYKIINDILHNSHSGLLSTGFLMAILLMTNGVNAILGGFESGHHVHDTLKRKFFRQYFVALGLSIILSFVLLITVAVIVIFEIFIQSTKIQDVLSDNIPWIEMGRYIFVILMILMTTSILFKFGIKHDKKRPFISIGSVFTTILIIISSYFFGIWVVKFSKYNELYGSIGTLLVVMFYIWINCMVLLLGFDLNASIQHIKREKTKRTGNIMRITTLLFFILFFKLSFGQTVFGRWKTIDDISGKEKGIVEIFEYKGKAYGKVVEIFEESKKHIKCENCDGEEKDKPVMGMNIIRGLSKDGDIYNGGKVLDPKNGKWYHCKIALDGKDKLIVRGYIGIPLFGRSQTWIRQK